MNRVYFSIGNMSPDDYTRFVNNVKRWMNERKIKYEVGFWMDDIPSVVFIENNEDAIAFKLTFGL